VVDTDKVSRLMQNLDVFISIRQKPKQNVVSVIIKGIERNASKCSELCVLWISPYFLKIT